MVPDTRVTWFKSYDFGQLIEIQYELSTLGSVVNIMYVRFPEETILKSVRKTKDNALQDMSEINGSVLGPILGEATLAARRYNRTGNRPDVYFRSFE